MKKKIVLNYIVKELHKIQVLLNTNSKINSKNKDFLLNYN